MKRSHSTTRLRPYLPELALVLAAVLYGSTFVLVQKSLHHVTPSAFNVLRFALATAVLVPFFACRGWRGPQPRPTDSWRTLLMAGSALGVVSLVAYQTQNVGIHHTSTSNASFITGLFVVFTPVIAAVRYSVARAAALSSLSDAPRSGCSCLPVHDSTCRSATRSPWSLRSRGRSG